MEIVGRTLVRHTKAAQPKEFFDRLQDAAKVKVEIADVVCLR